MAVGEPKKIPGWSTQSSDQKKKSDQTKELDPSKPIQIEELPQEEISEAPLEEFPEESGLASKEDIKHDPVSERSSEHPSHKIKDLKSLLKESSEEDLHKSKESQKNVKVEKEKPQEPHQENIYVILEGLDKVTARVFTLEARIGEAVEFENLTIIPHFCKISDPEEAPETIVFLEIHEKTHDKGSRQVFSGWMFSSSPSSSALEHPIYDVWVKSAVVRLKDEAQKPLKEESSSASEASSKKEKDHLKKNITPKPKPST